MAQTVKIKRSTANNPSTLNYGELALRDTSGAVKVFAGNNSNAPKELPDINGLASKASPDAAADYTIIYDAAAGINKKILLNQIGGSSSTEKLVLAITQTAHGFSVGNAIAVDSSGNYIKADATQESTAEFVGFCSVVTDANNFTLTLSGYITGLSGLTAGSVYFLSTTAGSITTTEPSAIGNVVLPVLKAKSTTTGYIERVSGFVVSSPNTILTDGYTLKRLTVFTSSGTWTKGVGIDAVLVKLVGAGGGGGGCGSTQIGGGGGAGGYAESFITSGLGSSETVTVGTGGAGGAGGGLNSGTSGSTTSFGSHLSGTGGVGGSSGGGYGGSGNVGTVSNGTGWTSAGQAGGAIGNYGSGNGDSGPNGGSSLLGGGGRGGSGGTGAGTAGSNGGGGGGSMGSGASIAGGNGGNGLVLVYEYAFVGDAVNANLIANGYTLRSKQVFTSSGTWTRPNGVDAIFVQVQGGGGQGGGQNSSNPSTGGGGGGYGEKFITSGFGSTETVTIGAGGSGAGASSNGNNGGTSSFGSFVTANGGTGGKNTVSIGTGAGGVSTGGDININGGAGGLGATSSLQGEGGDSFLSNNTNGGIGGTGGTGASYGGGGGGSGTGNAGGPGASGVIIVWEYVYTEKTIAANIITKQCIISNNVTDAVNDIDFSTAYFQFEDFSGKAQLLTALTKRLDASWAVGNNNGGLFSGAKANNTWYNCFLIYNPTTNTVDAGFDTSFIAANAPSGYVKYKRVGYIRTDSSGTIRPFDQFKDKFLFKDKVLDRSIASSLGTTSRVLQTVTVPPLMIGIFSGMGNGGGPDVVNIVDPASTDVATTTENGIAGSYYYNGFNIERKVNSSSQVAIRSNATAYFLSLNSQGWIDYLLT